MELVYLWVEDYKNIHRQGFNFSPRFNCHYDGETFTIDENKDFVSIFPENINVTAIVGENGSGKSSILEVLSSLYMNVYINSKEDKSFTIYRDEKQFYLYCDNAKETIKIDKFINIVNNTKLANPDGFSHRADYKISYFSNCLTDMTNKKQFELFKSPVYDFHNGSKPIKQLMKDNKNLADFEQKFSNILKDDSSFFHFLDENLLFDSFRYEIHISELEAYLAGDNPFYQELSFRKENIEDKEKLFYRFLIVLLINETENLIFNSSDEKFNQNRPKPMEDFFKTEVTDKTTDFSTKDYDFTYYAEIKKICIDSLIKINENEKISSLVLDKEQIKKIIDSYSIESKIKKPIQNNEYEIGNEPPKETSADKIFKSKDFKLTEKINLNDFEKELLGSNILEINFFDSRKTNCNFLFLSTGEQEYLKILTNVTYSIKRLSTEKKYLFLFDEIEISLHPNWQKKLISNMDSILKKLKKRNIHFVLTSHSPFLLSDLPKENVIFLKDGKQVEGTEKKQTFGANIHTLLSDGFFMNDGLMGEFAKQTINKIIADLKNDNYKPQKEEKERVLKIIQTIGEPFLKQKLLDLYYKKFDKEARKKELEKEKARIEEELKKYD